MQNHLTKRGPVYYFRRKVPVDIQEAIGCKQLMYSLQTRDPAEAKVRAAVETVKADARFAAVRARLVAASASSDGLGQALADVYLRDEEWQREYEANAARYDGALEGERRERAAVDALLKSAGLPTATQLEYLQVAGGFDPEDLPTPEQRARVMGQTPMSAGVATDSRKDAHATGERAKTLRHVVPSWIRRTRASDNAVGRMNKAIDLFEDAVGVIPLADLRKAHGAAFVRFLLDTDKRAFAAKTAHNHASNITALLNVAVKDDLIDRNPLDLAFDKKADAQTREPWTDAELERMFSSPLFSDRIDTVPKWQGVEPKDGRALLLILQHTGARIGEIAQLRRGDFLARDGIVCINVTPEAGTLKTAESRRVVPLADHLLADAWFASWQSEIMGGGRPGEPAFPSMAGRARGPADTAVQWFREFRKDAKLPLGRLEGSHKFRHWIRSALAAKGVGDATADSITGHAAQGSSGRVVYTAAASLPVMLEALNRLRYPMTAR